MKYTLTDEEKESIKLIECIGRDFMNACDLMGNSTELYFAKSKMEDAVLWAVKHITK